MEGQSRVSERVFTIKTKQSLLGKDKIRLICYYEQKKPCYCLQQPSQPEMEGPEPEVRWQTDKMGPLVGRALEHKECNLSTQQVRSRNR